MAKRMLIDATHPEETRVVVLNGNRLEEFDFESSTKQQVKGNIYLAKVTRVEPSLQAAFVEYGGNRHGFLAFSEIHPDYFRIPVGDRAATGGMPARPDSDGPDGAGDAADEAGVPLETALPEPVAVAAAGRTAMTNPSAPKRLPSRHGSAGRLRRPAWSTRPRRPPSPASRMKAATPDEGHEPMMAGPDEGWGPAADSAEPASAHGGGCCRQDGEIDVDRSPTMRMAAAAAFDEAIAGPAETLPAAEESAVATEAREPGEGEAGDAEIIETLGGDEFEEAERQRSRAPRHYKIQEVIKRRQIMLVQVTKEERGNKGAALTTYLSLAGRYCVLMPNTARGGGVSRKITSISDRRRLKDILEELDIPEGMGVIVRTAGAERSKAEIKRDYEYLLRLWNEIRELTLRSTAPALIYEEGNLIKRSIRDLYTRDIEEVLVEGEEGYRTAKAFMKMLMPSHAKRVQPYRDPQIGLLHRFQVESQIDAIHSPIVQLRSGGYVVINQTEALVAIDVNSGPLDARAQHRRNRAAHQSRSGRRDRAPAAAARPRRADRDRLHRHGGASQQRGGRAAAQGRAEERPRPHPGRPHQPVRAAGDVAPAAAAVAGRGLDPALPALRRHRLYPLDRIDRPLCAALDRGGRDPAPLGRGLRLCADHGRALHPQP